MLDVVDLREFLVLSSDVVFEERDRPGRASESESYYEINHQFVDLVKRSLGSRPISRRHET